MRILFSTMAVVMATTLSKRAAVVVDAAGHHPCLADDSSMSLPVFNEDASTDTIEGDGSKFGERILWSNSPFNSQDGSTQMGAANGVCTVINESPVRYLCHYHVLFGDGVLDTSILSFSGVSVDYGDGAAIMPITGGTQCLAGADGSVTSNVPDDPADTIFVTTISLADDDDASTSSSSCPTSAALGTMMFTEDASSDFLEGNATLFGERILWSNSPFNSKDGTQQGMTNGECVVIQEQPDLKYFCNYEAEFVGDGPLSGSSLTFSGVSVDYGDGSGFLTITGGTGCFLEAAGYVESKVPDDPNNALFDTTISLQEGKPDGCPSATDLAGIMFQEDTTNDYVEGTATSFGERIFWYNSPFNSVDGNHKGTSAGYCTTVGESPVLYICHYNVEFSEGALTGSRLAFSGVSVDYGDGDSTLTITGGTGCFAPATGYVTSRVPDDPSNVFFNTTIHLTTTDDDKGDDDEDTSGGTGSFGRSRMYSTTMTFIIAAVLLIFTL